MSDYLTKTQTYYLGRGNSIIWNPQSLDHLGTKGKDQVPQCPEDWDKKADGDAPMYFYGTYIKRCPKAACTEPKDWEYEILPGSENSGPCKHLNKWWDDIVSGYCTPESAENAYFGESVTFTHTGGPLSVYVCGNIEGPVIYGITYSNWDPHEPLDIGSPIEACLCDGVDYKLQAFADDDETCGTLGTGGNWATDPERPGWFFVETVDPFDLKCPGFAGHPDLDGYDFRYPNYALPKYEVVGGCIKYEYDPDGLGSPEYELPVDTYEFVWDTKPPDRPEFAEWPPRHTEKGAWIATVPVNYYGEVGSWDNPEVQDWVLELVFHRQDGLWMIILYNTEGKKTHGKGRSVLFDVFVNPHTIGPCRLGLVEDVAKRTFVPVRSRDPLFIDGEFEVVRKLYV